MRVGKISIDIKNIISSSDEKQKKEIIQNYYKYDMDVYDICDIISSINDDKYKQDIIEHPIDYGFRTNHVVQIVASMNSDDIKDRIIKERGNYNLSTYDILTITSSMNVLSIRRILNNYNDYPLEINDLANIVRHIKNDNLKKEILSNNNNKFSFENIANIVASIKDDEYKKFYIDKFIKNNAGAFALSIIIQSIKDDNYKYNLLDKYKEYGLDSDDMIFIIESIENEEYIHKIINDYKKYNFNQHNLAEIICLIRDDIYKAGIVYSNSYSFDSVKLTMIINSITNKELQKNLMDLLYKNGIYNQFEINKTLTIPDDMTFGIEIEAEGSYNRIMKTGMLPKGWLIKSDPTLKHGIEAISPILKNGSEQEIGKVCSIMKSLKLEATRSCAGHVHIGTSFFENDVNGFKNLLEIFSNMERVLYLISNEEGDIPRKYIFKYALPITIKLDHVISSGAVDFNDLNNLERFSRMIKLIQKSRFSSINFNNMGVPHKDTIEFRVANGTIDPNVWIDNINLFGGIMWISKIISKIQKKSINSITDDEKKVLYYYESLKDQNISEREKLESLLSILPMLDKQVYLNRYDVNNELYSDFEQNELLKEVSRLKPIRISECSNKLREIIDKNYKQVFGDISNKNKKM